MITVGHTVISCADAAIRQGDPLDLSDCHAMAQVLAGRVCRRHDRKRLFNSHDYRDSF
jgi:hypothetical protein